jgi:hypothetical protein
LVQSARCNCSLQITSRPRRKSCRRCCSYIWRLEK